MNLSIGCREFRNKHVAFVDDVLPAIDMEAMRRHLTRCPKCSRQDTAIRRSLMLVRNLPTIEPSAEFMKRLSARLAEIGPPSYAEMTNPRSALPSFRAFVVLAAGIGAIAVISIEASRYFNMTTTHEVVPIAAAEIDSTSTSATNAAIVASVPTGMPVWPAVLMVGEAPLRFANMEFHESTR
jgi:anti-sigma factor RsiW